MSTTMLNPARVSSVPILPDAATETPALPTVPDPVRPGEPAHADLPFEEIQAEAYRLYLDRGGEDGHDIEDWLAAEAIVRARIL